MIINKLNKSTFIELMNDDSKFYSFFDYDDSYCDDLTDHLTEHNSFKVFNIVDRNGNRKIISIKLAGDMIAYGYLHVPISVFKITKSNKEGYECIRFIAHTIDDASMGFFYYVRPNDVDSFMDLCECYIKSIDRIPSIANFEAFWNNHNIDASDYDYN